MKHCAITLTKGERPGFLQHCIYQMRLNNVDYYIIDYPAKPYTDIHERFYKAIELYKEYDYITIIEDDDYYPDNYINEIPLEGDIIGIPYSIYYNIINKRCRIMEHQGRASLFCTTIRTQAFINTNIPDSNFFDIQLWKLADSLKLTKTFFIPIKQPIGIKHGVGSCVGGGHDEHFYSNNSPAQIKFRPQSEAFYDLIISNLQHQDLSK